jgi:4a-hydroxytetrahydrobiopterin dehydratase
MTTFSREPLSEQAVKTALGALDDWSFEKDAIHRTFVFSTFREAMSFLVRVGFEAEAMNHHPELNNVYNRVRVSLNTHDAGNKVTELDTELARRINHFSWI